MNRKKRKKKCPTCKGTGMIFGRYAYCPTCSGEGRVDNDGPDGDNDADDGGGAPA